MEGEGFGARSTSLCGYIYVTSLALEMKRIEILIFHITSNLKFRGIESRLEWRRFGSKSDCICFLDHLVLISWQIYCYLHQTVGSVISDFVVSVCRGDVSAELIRPQPPRVSPFINQHPCPHNHPLCSHFWCFPSLALVRFDLRPISRSVLLDWTPSKL